VFNRKTIPKLRCRAIAGAANNQLETPADAARLEERHILYAPDYVVSAGGIINILVGLQGGRKGYDRVKAERLAKRIPLTLQEIFREARAQGITTAQAADELAEARLEEAGTKKMNVRAHGRAPARERTRRTRGRR
jgi:leucine dehydrogenase